MFITISGTPGAGKGTTKDLLSKKLGWPSFSMGDIRRNVARSKGMTLEQLNRYGETHPSTDRDVDRWVGQMAKKIPHGIFDGRVAWHFVPQSIKVFLVCSRRVGARRIMNDPHEKRRREADFSSLAKTEAALARRVASDTHRFRKYYNVNIFDQRHYDLVVRTTSLTPIEVRDKILDFLRQKEKKANVSQRVDNQGKARRRSTGRVGVMHRARKNQKTPKVSQR